MRISIRTDIPPQRLRLQAKTVVGSLSIRHLTLARLVEGEDVRTVATDLGVSTAIIYYWIRQFNELGLQALDKQSGLRVDANMSAEKFLAAAKTADTRTARRLLSIAKLLGGQRPSHIARELGVSPSTIQRWISRINEGGMAGLLYKGRRPSRLAARMRNDIMESDLLRVALWASAHGAWRTARRLNGVADILGGLKLAEAAERRNVSRSMVSKWCRTFNKNGIEGLLCPKSMSALQRGHTWDSDGRPLGDEISATKPGPRAIDRIMTP